MLSQPDISCATDTQNPAVLTVQSRGERLRSLVAKLVLFAHPPAKAHPVLQPQNHSTLVMSTYSTIDRESLQKVRIKATVDRTSIGW